MKSILRVAIVREIPETRDIQVLVDQRGKPLWIGVSKLKKDVLNSILARLPFGFHKKGLVKEAFEESWKLSLDKLKHRTLRVP